MKNRYCGTRIHIFCCCAVYSEQFAPLHRGSMLCLIIFTHTGLLFAVQLSLRIQYISSVRGTGAGLKLGLKLLELFILCHTDLRSSSLKVKGVINSKIHVSLCIIGAIYCYVVRSFVLFFLVLH